MTLAGRMSAKWSGAATAWGVSAEEPWDCCTELHDAP